MGRAVAWNAAPWGSVEREGWPCSVPYEAACRARGTPFLGRHSDRSVEHLGQSALPHRESDALDTRGRVLGGGRVAGSVHAACGRPGKLGKGRTRYSRSRTNGAVGHRAGCALLRVRLGGSRGQIRICAPTEPALQPYGRSFSWPAGRVGSAHAVLGVHVRGGGLKADVASSTSGAGPCASARTNGRSAGVWSSGGAEVEKRN